MRKREYDGMDGQDRQEEEGATKRTPKRRGCTREELRRKEERK